MTVQQLDADKDGVLSDDEIENNSIVLNITYPDVDLFDAAGNWHPGADGKHDALSVGFAFHAVPCDSGRCSTAPPRDYCVDRVTDNDETDHDCGGTTCSLRCAAGRHCLVGSDCQSGRCASGVCG
jgi:hypothetical protein